MDDVSLVHNLEIDDIAFFYDDGRPRNFIIDGKTFVNDPIPDVRVVFLKRDADIFIGAGILGDLACCRNGQLVVPAHDFNEFGFGRLLVGRLALDVFGDIL